MSTGEGPREKVCKRRSAREGLREKGRWRKSVREGSWEKGRQRRSIEEGLREKVYGRRSAGEGPSEKRDVEGRGPVRKRIVAEKEALIPCEKKNNSPSMRKGS